MDKTRIFQSALSIRSSEPPSDLWPHASNKGFLFGYCVDTGKPVFIPYADLMQHIFIAGMSGVGKTVLGSWLMFQQIRNGGGLAFVDGKLDKKTLVELWLMCVWAGREKDLLVINPGDPSMSNTYNPVLYGDADEVAARPLFLIPSTENNPGADHYKQSANQGLTTLVSALKRAGLAYNFIDLTILLMNPMALTYLENRVPPSKEKTALSLFLDQYRVTNKDGVSTIDMKKLKDTFGGIGGRLFQFGTGTFGEVMNTYSPEVNLYEAVRGNKIVYVMLPTMGKNEAATNFAKMFLADLRTAISWIQNLPDSEKPDPPYLAFLDEAGSYANMSLARPIEQSRSARIMLCPAVQTIANLEAVSPEFAQMILGSTWTKVFFKLGSHETALQAAEIMDKERRVQDSLSGGVGHGSSGKANAGAADQGVSESANLSFGERETEEYKVSPNDLKALDRGEAIIQLGGRRIYHVRVPKLDFTRQFMKEAGKVRLNHYRHKPVPGIELFKRAEKYLLGGRDDE